MKKITYLVAPLMVLPFLVGCNNKPTGYNVSVSSVSSHLKFTSEDGKKDISKVKAKKGKDFKFKVQAEEGTTPFKIVSDFVLVAVNNEVLYEGVTVTPDNEGDYSKSAIVTVDKSKVTGDIIVGGIAGIEGYYIYDIPMLSGVRVTKIEGESEFPGYVECGKDLKITFSENSPKAVAYQDGNWKYFESINETLTIAKDTVTESIMIFARGPKAPWLDYFSWEQINSISDSGFAEHIFAVGDTKTITVNEQPHVVEIIGFNHDCIDDPTDKDPTTLKKAGITFRFKTLISGKDGKALTTAWGSSHQGYVSSTLQGFIQNQVTGMLPPELQAVLQPVYKPVGLYKETGWYIKNYQTGLFPLSTKEYDQEDAYYSVKDEGEIYSGLNTTKDGLASNVLKDASGTAHNYWLRSPSKKQGGIFEYNNAFVMQSVASGLFTYDEGTVAGLDVSTPRAVAPGFCI